MAAELGEAYVVPLEDGIPLKRRGVSHIVQALPPNFDNADSFHPMSNKEEARCKLQLTTDAVIDSFASLCEIPLLDSGHTNA